MHYKLLSFIVAIAVLGISCNDNSNDMVERGTASMQVSLIDDPAQYDAVLIDVQGLSYKIETDTSETAEDNKEGSWNTVDIEPRVYDILELNNGEEALLADTDIPEGELKEIRLILGDQNQVVIENDTLDLTIPSGSSSGLKLKVDADIEANESYKLTLDFDAAKSIHETGNGKFILKPVIRVFLEETDESEFGSISGVVSPDSISSVVYVIEPDDEDTVSTIPEADGSFLVTMLEADSYHVIAIPAEDSGFNAASKEGVVVVAGETTELDTLKFNQ
ncbi:protein of unknown function [Ekhidna lutea]|uniref:DUF4382 domain-containing protein n=1 Tax=Ekhidna lutea TaxID=447679 RepID=A0A239GPF2_EKHLU|nr:DUF4382 domain-containing protein [Ekhidna lutea]SNS70373.1 protein of unknown function [Ekhidna lutea]